MRHLTIYTFLILLFNSCIASRGDNLEIFQRCVSDHIDHHCSTTKPLDLKHGAPLPIYLRALFWTCPSNADYICQRAVTQYLIDSNHPIEQFHGKWPFIRVFGIQEPVSVFFSLMNGVVHYHGLSQIRQKVPVLFPMRRYYIVFAYIGINAWVWSSVFHTRDFPVTEKMDYFSAGSYVLYGFYYAPIRVLRVYESRYYAGLVNSWGMICLLALMGHITYLTFVTFDYGYNMLANVVVGALHGLIWIIYSVLYHRDRPSWVWWPVLTVVALAGAMSLELFDFSPFWYAVDAHALWHLSTVPITWFWYQFLVRDAEWEHLHASNEAKRKS